MKRCMYLALVAIMAMGVNCKKENKVAREGMVNFIAGSVTIVDDGKRKQAEIGDVIRQGMIIETGPLSFVDIYFDETAVKILEKSVVEIKNLSHDLSNDAQATLFHVRTGRVFSRVVKKLAKNDRFEVSSQTMIAAVRGTEFLVESDELKSLIACLNGSVEVENETAPERDTVTIVDEQEVVVEKDKPMTVRDLSDENRRLMGDIKKNFREMKQEIRKRFEENREEIRKKVEDRRREDIEAVERRKAEDQRRVEEQKARDRENIERVKGTTDATSGETKEGVDRLKEDSRQMLESVKPEIKKFNGSLDENSVPEM